MHLGVWDETPRNELNLVEDLPDALPSRRQP